MTGLDWLTVVGAVISGVLGVVAIWLSVLFFKMSSDQARESRENAQKISASVSKLEKLFDSLYSDTFAMMRETVTDMRSQIWRRLDNGGSAAESADSRQLDSFKDEVLRTVEEVTESLGVTDANLEKLQNEIRPALDDLVARGQKEERLVRASDTQTAVLASMRSRRRRGKATSMQQLIHTLGPRGFNSSDVADALFVLRESGEIEWAGPPNQLKSDQEVWMAGSGPRDTSAGGDD